MKTEKKTDDGYERDNGFVILNPCSLEEIRPTITLNQNEIQLTTRFNFDYRESFNFVEQYFEHSEEPTDYASTSGVSEWSTEESRLVNFANDLLNQ